MIFKSQALFLKNIGSPFLASLIRVSSVFAVFATLAACSTMAPEYSQPAAMVATKWPEGLNHKSETARDLPRPVAEIPWREFYLDPKLRKVIALALDNNRDLRVAVLNMKRYQALYQIRRSDLMPKVDASASATIQRIPEDLSSTGRAMTTDQYNVGLGLVSYELDIFGRVQSLKGQALEQYLGTEQGARSVQISLVSQISGAWLTLAADRERLKLAKATLASQQESYQLIQRRYDAGISSSLDLQQGIITVETARVDIARYTALVAQDENFLNFLVGTQVPPELLPQKLSETITALKDIYPGTPSDVLLQRPDILQAEAQLKGANANIGAARAAFFPRITLVSSVGFGSDELAGLFKGGSFAWSFAPRISLPIFDGGRNKANLKVAEVDRDIFVAQYEKAIQSAFREVADALAQRSTIDEQVAAQQTLTNATAERYHLSQARFDKGVDSHLNVLDSQRTFYSAQQGLITARQSRMVNMVTLYKTLGGGSGK